MYEFDSNKSNTLYFLEGLPLLYATKSSEVKINSFALESINSLNIGSFGDIEELMFFLLYSFVTLI